MEGGDPLDITSQTRGQWVTEALGAPTGAPAGLPRRHVSAGLLHLFFKEKPEIYLVLATLCMCE